MKYDSNIICRFLLLIFMLCAFVPDAYLPAPCRRPEAAGPVYQLRAGAAGMRYALADTYPGDDWLWRILPEPEGQMLESHAPGSSKKAEGQGKSKTEGSRMTNLADDIFPSIYIVYIINTPYAISQYYICIYGFGKFFIPVFSVFLLR